MTATVQQPFCHRRQAGGGRGRGAGETAQFEVAASDREGYRELATQPSFGIIRRKKKAKATKTIVSIADGGRGNSIFRNYVGIMCPCGSSSVGRAGAFQAPGRRFETGLPLHYTPACCESPTRDQGFRGFILHAKTSANGHYSNCIASGSIGT